MSLITDFSVSGKMYGELMDDIEGDREKKISSSENSLYIFLTISRASLDISGGTPFLSKIFFIDSCRLLIELIMRILLQLWFEYQRIYRYLLISLFILLRKCLSSGNSTIVV
jgi:hypothetical protein